MKIEFENVIRKLSFLCRLQDIKTARINPCSWSSANLEKYEELTLQGPLKLENTFSEIFRIKFFAFNIKWTQWS